MAKASEGDLYEVLGVDRAADQEEIKRAYRAAAKKFHPDAEGNTYFFRLIQTAYETLSDPRRRAEYDRAGCTAPTSPPPPTAQPDQRWAPSAVPVIPAEEIAWWDRIDPNAKIRWRGRFAPIEFVFALVALAWLAFVAFGLATSTLAQAGGYGYLVFCLIVAPTVWCIVGALFGRKPVKAAVLGSMAAGGILLLLTWFAQTHGLAHPGTIFGYAVGALVMPWFAARFAPYRGRARIDWLANVWQLRGQGSMVRSESTAGLTADLLARYLTHIPAVRVFRDPDLGRGVDHLLLCGRRIVLISSVAWPPGDYTFGRGGEVFLDNRPVGIGGPLGMAEALRTGRRRFRRAQVRGVVLNWPPQAAAYQESAWTPAVDYAVTGPETLVKQVGGWLAESPLTVHRGVFRTVLTSGR